MTTDLAPYPIETLPEDDDDGTMPENVELLRAGVVGHRIVAAERTTRKLSAYAGASEEKCLVITLDNGKEVVLADSDDCCAFTELEDFWLDPRAVDHVITGVGTTDGYETWHVYADMGDVLRLKVGWSPGNPFYYGYGFEIRVQGAILDA